MIAMAAITLFCAGCVASWTPVDEQKWYEYQPCWGADGYRGNKPWYYYPVVVPCYVILYWGYWVWK